MDGWMGILLYYSKSLYVQDQFTLGDPISGSCHDNRAPEIIQAYKPLHGG